MQPLQPVTSAASSMPSLAARFVDPTGTEENGLAGKVTGEQSRRVMEQGKDGRERRRRKEVSLTVLSFKEFEDVVARTELSFGGSKKSFFCKGWKSRERHPFPWPCPQKPHRQLETKAQCRFFFPKQTNALLACRVLPSAARSHPAHPKPAAGGIREDELKQLSVPTVPCFCHHEICAWSCHRLLTAAMIDTFHVGHINQAIYLLLPGRLLLKPSDPQRCRQECLLPAFPQALARGFYSAISCLCCFTGRAAGQVLGVHCPSPAHLRAFQKGLFC